MLAFVVQSASVEPKLAIIRRFLEKLECEVRSAESIASAMNNPSLLAAANSLIIVPESADPKKDVQEIAKHSAKVQNRAFVLYIAQRISPEDYKSLLHLGPVDITDWDSAIREIDLTVQRLRKEGVSSPAPPSDTSDHRVVSFVGTGGGAGNTTVAMEAGVYLASLKRNAAGRVALFDLDLQGSVVCDYLDLAPRVDWAEITKNPERLDAHMLGIFASRHSSGLDVFASRRAPGGPETDEINDAAILTLLNRLIEHYDIVIIDVPSYRREGAAEILQNSDFVCVCGLFSVPSVRQIHRMLQRLNVLGIHQSRTAAVITDTETNVLGMVSQRFNVKNILVDERIFFVRKDHDFAMESVDAGVSMMASQPGRAICKDIGRIAEHIRTIAPAAAAPGAPVK